MKNVSFELKKSFFKTKLGISEHRQFEILEAALELIQKEGFEQLQFGVLAKKCKISRSLVHHYFRDKLELAHRLLELSNLFLQNYVQEQAAKEKNPAHHFQIYCKATLDWAVNKPNEARGLLLFIYISSQSPETRKLNDDLSTLRRQKIQTLMAQMSSGSKNLESRAQVIQTVLLGCCARLLTENLTSSESLRLRSECVKNCVDLAMAR